jgi:predicted RNase H-like HicB family nuclease
VPVKSKKSAAGKKIDRPIAPEIMERAQTIARQYQVIVSCDEGQWFGRGLELPRVFGDGKTANQCIENTREALAVAVAYMLEEGERPPTPATEGRRTAQVNVRLTAEEKALFEVTAKRMGYSGISDYLRAAAIEVAK